MTCRLCEEKEGEVSVLNADGDVVLVCLECADRLQEELFERQKIEN